MFARSGFVVFHVLVVFPETRGDFLTVSRAVT